MEELQHTLAKNIRMARAQKQLSQEDLADLTGLDRTYLSGVERGIRNPTIKVLEKIAAGLSIEPFELLKKPEG